MKPCRGSPLTLGSTAVHPRAADRVVQGAASIRSSPIPLRWLVGTAPKRPCSILAPPGTISSGYRTSPPMHSVLSAAGDYPLGWPPDKKRRG
jgi:hypothetical protein